MKLQSDDPIYGVFAFLDVVLAGVFREHPPEDNDHRAQITQGVIEGAFRLDDSFRSVGERLEEFNLYLAEDKADALARAYFLNKSGADPLPALMGDYVPSWAILTVIAEDEWRNPSGPLSDRLRQLAWYAKAGDKIVHFSTMDRRGLMLIRNLHRVREITELRITLVRSDEQWEAAKEEFDRKGGARGVLTGKFEWPVAATPE